MIPRYEIPAIETIDALPNDNLNYLHDSSIQALRSAQEEYRTKAQDEAGAGSHDYMAISIEKSRALAEMPSHFDEMTRDYLILYIAEDDPKFEEHYAKLREFSIDNMSREEYTYGPLNADGTFNEVEAGWRRLHNYRQNELETTDDGINTTLDLLRAETTASETTLGTVRSALAKAEVEFRSKKWVAGIKSRKELKQLRDTYLIAQRDASLKRLELAKATRASAGEAELTAAELNEIALSMFKDEYGLYADEQNNETYLTDFGKKAREIGRATLGKKLRRAALPIAAAALGVATGGLAGAALIGTAGVMRSAKNHAGGTIGHSTKKSTENVTTKVTKKTANEATELISANTSTDSREIAGLIAASNGNIAERIHVSNTRRRTVTAAVTSAALFGGIFKAYESWNDSKYAFGTIKDFLNGDKTSNSYRIPAERIPNLTTQEDMFGTGFGHPGAPGAISEIQLSGNPTSAMYENLDSLLNAEGSYPWARALDFYNGDAAGAKGWLEMAVSKTPGAEWHNVGDGIGSNDWISINGRSDTDYVWAELTKNMLSN